MFRPTHVLALAALTTACPAIAAGDLLVAPTRILLDGARGTEIVLNNIGTEPATYRISLELRRMNARGGLDEVLPAAANATETAALAMISYAPRRVTLPPNQPQTIRIGARFAPGLADGEYRAHMLFRAIPDAAAPSNAQSSGPGLSIALIPIYGVTIPVIVRKGALKAVATMRDVRLAAADGAATATLSDRALAFTLVRSGDRSVYGRIVVRKAGVAKPVFEARGIAVYAETTERTVTLQLKRDELALLSGPVSVEYREDNESGGLIASAQGVLR